jgi:radical SAM protein with 4Fe4S-binding SPASM domain
MADSLPTDGSRTQAINQLLSSDYILEHYLKNFTGGLTVMTNNICNARCVFCAYPSNIDPKTTMSLELFKHTLDSAFEIGHVGTLPLTPVAGDPLADPTLCEKIAYARAKGVEIITFNTNGILFRHKELYRRVLDAAPNHIGVSTPGFHPERYKALFGVDRCKEVVDSLRLLGDYKRTLGATCKTTVDVSTGFDRITHDDMALPGWRTLRAYFDDGTFTLTGWPSVKAMLDAAPAVTMTLDNWSGSFDESAIPDNLTVRTPTHTASDIPCWRLLDDAAVMPDGKVRVCSCRYMNTTDDELVIGDLTEQPFSEILYSDKHKRLIKDVAGGKWPEVCLKCSLYKPAAFSKAEVDVLAAEAKRQHNRSDETFPINSSESLKARAQAKLNLARSLIASGDSDHGFNHLQGALSYSTQLASREPNNADSLALLKEAQVALDIFPLAAALPPMAFEQVRTAFAKMRKRDLSWLTRRAIKATMDRFSS